jgi:RsiW-degrading membrane proteinase PrsW (M82 family)
METPAVSPAAQHSWANVLLTVGLLICSVVFLSQLPFFMRAGAGTFLTNVWYHVYVLVWLLVITALGRTLPLRLLATAFFVGLFLSMAVALAIGFPLARMVGTDTRLFDVVLVPVLEESTKSLPILLLFWFLARRGTWQPSMTDGLLLGFLVGAGFALHEDAMYGRVVGSGFDGAFGMIFPTISNYHIRGTGQLFHFYHAEWTALLGLALGAAFFFRQRLQFSWCLPVAALGVIWLDHGRVNYMIGEGSSGWIFAVLTTLDMNGRLPVYLLLGGIVAAVAIEVTLLHRIRREEGLFTGIPVTTLLSGLQAGGVAGLRHIQAAREYIRARRAVHYALWRTRPMGMAPEQITAMGLMLASLGQRAGLIFDEPTTDDPESDAGTVRMTS